MAIEAVEATILAKLEGILSPVKITFLDKEVVTKIAGESDESRARRKLLTSQLEVLRNGSGTCKQFMSRRLPGMDTPRW